MQPRGPLERHTATKTPAEKPLCVRKPHVHGGSLTGAP